MQEHFLLLLVVFYVKVTVRLFSRSQECPDESCMSVPKKTCKDDPCFLSYFNACDHQADHKTTINTTLFDRAFDISVINKFPTSNENYKTALSCSL